MQIPYEVKPRRDTGLWNAKIGIWLFLASEVMLFGGLFSGYVFLRLSSHGEADYFWPIEALAWEWGAINTVVLILSSVFVVVAWLHLKLRDYKKYQFWMAMVILCSLAFLGIKAYEYSTKFTHWGIKLSDNSIVEGHGFDDFIKYEGITEVVVNVATYNGEMLDHVAGAQPKFQELVDGAPKGEPIDLKVSEVAAIAKRINEGLRKEYEAKRPQLKEELKAVIEKNKTLPYTEQVIRPYAGSWLPEMGVKQLTFVATEPFAVQDNRSKLRAAKPTEVKFKDQTALKGTISKQTPGVIIHEVDRIDLRAADGENIEDSLVWANLTHGKDEAYAHYIEHRDKILNEAAESGEEAPFEEIYNQLVPHGKDDPHVSVTVPWEQATLYSNFTPKWNTYFAIYFLLTGLHGLHVLIGAIVLFYFGFMSRWHYEKNPEHLANRVEVGGLFWHFVDLVWIFLFPILYLM